MKKVLVLLSLVILVQGTQAQSKKVTSYIFGHSLLDHGLPIFPTPSNETTVPHWIHLLHEEAGTEYSVSGQYGFLPQHADLPPISQWGYDLVEPAWESDLEPFSAADFTEVIFTAGNFMQWQPSHFPYPNGGGVTPLSATYDIVDWVNLQEDSVRFYVYENWPDMSGYLSAGFPPSKSDMTNYHAYTEGEFHDWWIEYHDSLLTYRPNLQIKMIPVGPIIARLLQTPELENIPYTDWYEDDAPHGRANLYFIASTITYMASCEQKAPTTFDFPDLIHPDIEDNFSFIVDQIWDELKAFNLPNGDSRVFFKPLTTSIDQNTALPQVNCSPNPAFDFIQLDDEVIWDQIRVTDEAGRVRIFRFEGSSSVDVRDVVNGVYFPTFFLNNEAVGQAKWIIKR